MLTLTGATFLPALTTAETLTRRLRAAFRAGILLRWLLVMRRLMLLWRTGIR